MRLHERETSVLAMVDRTPSASATSPLTPPLSSTTLSNDNGMDLDHNDHAIGGLANSTFANTTSIGNISTASKRLIEIMNNLSFLQIDQHIKLPKIVVTGDQSAGKSSLIEAMTTITVPRAEGTCTRCPIHVSLTEAREGTPWSCKIFIDQKYDFSASKRNATSGPWERRPEANSVFFANVHDPAEVETLLSRAQLAILNPNLNPALFSTLEKDVSTITNSQRQEFSPNVVRLDINGPGLPNLSFYDLPGVISNSKAGHAHLPRMVKNLIQEYLKPDTNIILLASTMHNDIENCAAKGLIHEARAENRCIGVLTKPDRVEAGVSLETWQAILSGQEHKLGYGYFVTKQPSPEQRKQGITHSEAREAEKAYFDTEAPWFSEFQCYRERCDTQNLQHKLSQLLIDAIKARIPVIYFQVISRLTAINTELKTLPAAPGDRALSAVVSSITKIHSGVRDALEGRYPRNNFMLQWKESIKTLKETFVAKRPTLIILMPTETTTEPIEIDSDEEEVVTPVNSPKKRAKPVKSEGVSKRQRETSTGDFVHMKVRLEDIRQELESVASLELQNRTDTRAASSLIRRAREHWPATMEGFIRETGILLRGELDALIESRLQEWSNTPLHAEMKDHLHKYVDMRLDVFADVVAHLLNAELLEPWTSDEETLQFYVKQERDLFTKKRQEKRTEQLAKTQTPTKSKLKPEDLSEDPYQPEIEVMALVRGYYKKASNDLVEQACKAVRLDVFGYCVSQLDVYLEEALKITAPVAEAMENSKRLLEQNPELGRRRDELLNERTNFEKAKKLLDELKDFEG